MGRKAKDRQNEDSESRSNNSGSATEDSELTDKEVTSDTLPQASPQTRYDLQVLQSLRQIIHAVDVYSRKLRTQYRITAPQLVCLNAICQNGSLTTTQIAGRVHLSPSTVVGILDRLEKQELIQRARDTKDRRLVNVTATDEGRRLVEHAPSLLQDRLANALQSLPDLEQATIALSLRRIADLMEVSPHAAPMILETGHLEVAEIEDPAQDAEGSASK
jgi:DNA-binding MarR family transcriptional regulator